MSVWFKINRYMVNTFRFRFDLRRFGKYFSVCTTANFYTGCPKASQHNGGPIEGLHLNPSVPYCCDVLGTSETPMIPRHVSLSDGCIVVEIPIFTLSFLHRGEVYPKSNTNKNTFKLVLAILENCHIATRYLTRISQALSFSEYFNLLGFQCSV